MASVCRAQNRATCRTHGMGSPVERLELEKARAMSQGDFRTQYEIQQKIDKYQDESPEGTGNKAGFFGEMGWKLFKKVRFEYLDTKTGELAEVLSKHKVFGKETGRWKEREIYNLQSMVRGHVESGDKQSLELTYPSAVRMIINTKIDDKGNAYINNIEVFSHPTENSNIDYAALNREARAVFNLNSPEDKKDTNKDDVEMVPCGKCSVCAPPPSDLTHFHNWSSKKCENPVPVKK